MEADKLNKSLAACMTQAFVLQSKNSVFPVMVNQLTVLNFH